MAAAAIAIPPPEPMKKTGNLADNWRQFKQNFEIYLGATGISVDDSKACPLFLHNIGQFGRDIFNGMDVSQPHNLEEFYTKFDDHCNPKKNLTLDRFLFFNTKQEDNQTFDKYLAVLKQRSMNCEFGELSNNLLVVQIILGMNNLKLRKSLLGTLDLTLNQTIEACKSAEAASLHAKKVETVINSSSGKKQQPKLNPKLVKDLDQKLQAENLKSTPKEGTKEGKKFQPGIIPNCKFCSKSHAYGVCPVKTKEANDAVCTSCDLPHKKDKCPAIGSICKKCKKPDHYAKVCKE